MAKVQLKSETINPFGGLFSIFRQFDLSGMRSAIDKHLGKRGKTKAAYSYADVFSSLFASYFCGGDVVEDVMDVKPFWNHRDGIRRKGEAQALHPNLRHRPRQVDKNRKAERAQPIHATAGLSRTRLNRRLRPHQHLTTTPLQ